MTLGGWLYLLISIGGITGLLIWCIYKVLTGEKSGHDLGHVEPVHDDQLDER